jgi:hypothetical protein
MPKIIPVVWPVKLGNLKPALVEEATANNSSLHNWIYRILEGHVVSREGSLNAADLRLGNWHYVCEKGVSHPHQVNTIQLSEGQYLINGINALRCRPIPITKELLTKSGFKQGYDIFHINQFHVKPLAGAWQVTSLHKNAIATITYVHQLQNVFASIVEKQLIIKL